MTNHSDDLMTYLTASPSPYHAVAEAASRLDAAGFRPVLETEPWDTAPGGRYLVRGGALIAWFVPAAGVRGFRIFGAHTDSPGLRCKPRPDTGSMGWRQVAVEVYGGALLNTWLDRDLGISGRLVTADGDRHLVCVDRPLFRVPQLAIHLDRGVNDGLTLDRQRHLVPIWGLGDVHQGDLIAFLSKEAGIEEVVGWDLALHDVQPAAYLGRDDELIAAGRLDNLLSVHAGLTALIDSVNGDHTYVPMLAAFDHEEIGSESTTGAAGPLLETVLRRLVGGDFEAQARVFADSVCLSSDVGHAVHPNYPERHDPGHHPLPGGGPILKVNANQRYATDGVGRALWAAACERAGVEWQLFVANNAVPCGSTIGPITATRLGVETVDVGVAMLSMHSARELCGAADPELLTRAAMAFFD